MHRLIRAAFAALFVCLAFSPATASAATLIRTTVAEQIIGTKTYPINSVVLADDVRAAYLINVAKTAVAIETVSFDVDSNASATNKIGFRLDLAGAAQTVDLTSMASVGAARDGNATNFSAVHSLLITSAGTGTNLCTVGAAGSNPFVGFFGGTAPVIKVPAGQTFLLSTGASAGLTTSSANNLKFDPGADTFSVYVVIAGIGT